MAKSEHPVDPALVRELAAILREADLGEIEIKPTAPTTVSYAAPAAPAPQAVPAAPPAAAAPATVDSGTGLAANEEIIKSPMIGTFYRSPSPESPVFVDKGNNVTANTVVCIIEAMKVMNEIKADISGEILEILVGDAEAVEYGQPLFKVKRS